MGLYTVVKPCVVGLLHYVRPTTAPIEVDDDAAAELVESGSLVAYQSAVSEWDKAADAITESAAPPAEVVEKSTPRTRRKAAED
ncbi:MAG TPA: hypothetical protein PKI77_12595 [Mycobacterium sp.]|nr:hypothetical protein [Mycobacterium sp.]